MSWAEGVDETIYRREDSCAGPTRERDHRSFVDEVDAAMATYGGVEIVGRGEEPGIGLAEVRLPSADAAHPWRDGVEDQGLYRYVGASQRSVNEGADAAGGEIHEQSFADDECGRPGRDVGPPLWIGH